MKNIGVIGTGSMGTDHVRRLSAKIPGARVAALYDVDRSRAAALAQEVGAVARSDTREIIDDPSVDAVIIATPAGTHAELAVACIAARKPVLCEKPLAPSSDECHRVMDAEVAAGARLVQVGFMRRYDHGYRALKAALRGGAVGEPLIVHCQHRNPVAPPWFTGNMSLTDSLVHEIDITRWLLGEEIVASRVATVRRSPLAGADLRDPQLVLLEARSGTVIDVEVFINCQYGYDVRCEVAGSTGVASLDTPTIGTLARAGGRSVPVPQDWYGRFGDAYTAELLAWVSSLHAGKVDGPSAWDGYAATAVAESCIRSAESGSRATVELIARPGFYRGPEDS